MAQGFLKSFDDIMEVYSAGTNPSANVHPKAVQVMKEVNIDLSQNYPKDVEQYLDKTFDYVITVCGNAEENCPVFSGDVSHRLHIGFDDPAEASGSEDEVMTVFRRVRDEIKKDFYNFYKKMIE